MKNSFLIFTLALTAACAAEFNPDLRGTEDETSSGTGTDVAGSEGAEDGSGTSTSTTSPETTGDGDGDGDESTSSTSTETTGDGDTSDESGEGWCGNGVVDPGEECDMGDIPEDLSCESFGFANGFILCDQCYILTQNCDDPFCGGQPYFGPYSACDVPFQGIGTCDDSDLFCIGEYETGGYCASGCESDSDCVPTNAVGGQTVECGGIPRCIFDQGPPLCIIECELDQDCPVSMECEWSEPLNFSLCI